jgi:hypothetical protein
MTTPRTPPDADQIDRNIDLAFAFIAEHLESPARLAEIPRGDDEPTIVLLPDDDAELSARNLQLGLRAIQEGRNVYFRHVHGRIAASAG